MTANTMFGGSIKMHLSTVITAIFMALLVTLGGVLYRAARRSGQALSPAAAAVIGAGLTMATTLALFVFATALNYDPAVGLLWSDVLESFPPVLLIGAFVSVCVAAVFWAIAAMKQSKGGVKPGGCAQRAAEPGVGCREMKTRNIAIVAFMLGVVVASFVCTLLQRSDECARKSAVDMPTAAIIGVINEDLRANRIEDAHAKLRKLEKRFLYFCEGGKTPEQFYHEILTTENDSSQPTNPPYSSPRETQGSKR